MGMPAAVRGELDYADNVVRCERWKAAHPDTEIIYIGPHWQAITRAEGGMDIITRTSLGALLDTLQLRYP